MITINSTTGTAQWRGPDNLSGDSFIVAMLEKAARSLTYVSVTPTGPRSFPNLLTEEGLLAAVSLAGFTVSGSTMLDVPGVDGPNVLDADTVRQIVFKHYGPGPHDNGTEQAVHGRAGALTDRKVLRESPGQENLFGLPGGRSDVYTDSPEEIFIRSMPDADPDEVGQMVYENWVGMETSKAIRRAALDILGEDSLPADPHVDSEAGWGGGYALEPVEARAHAEYLMGSILEGPVYPELYRSVGTDGLSDEEGEFWDNLSVGDQFDAPLMATLSQYPVIGDNNLLDKFSTETLIKYENAAGFDGGQVFGGPFWMEEDEDVWLSDTAAVLRDDIEMFTDEGDQETADSYTLLADAIDKHLADPSGGRSELRSFFEDYDMPTRFAGDEISEETDSDRYYSWFDEGEGPTEVITGGRFMVTDISPDPANHYQRIVTVRQTHLFDPYREGNLVEVEER